MGVFKRTRETAFRKNAPMSYIVRTYFVVVISHLKLHGIRRRLRIRLIVSGCVMNNETGSNS